MDPVIPEGGYFIMADWSKLGKDAFDLMPILQEILRLPKKRSKVVHFYFQI